MFLSIFSFAGWIVELAGSVLSFLLQCAMAVLSALGSLAIAPWRAGINFFDRLWGGWDQWTPWFLLGGAAIVLIFLALLGHVLLIRGKRQ